MAIRVVTEWLIYYICVGPNVTYFDESGSLIGPFNNKSTRNFNWYLYLVKTVYIVPPQKKKKTASFELYILSHVCIGCLFIFHSGGAQPGLVGHSRKHTLSVHGTTRTWHHGLRHHFCWTQQPQHHTARYVSVSGVGVTKAPFVNFSISKIFYCAEVNARFVELHSYLTGVTAAERMRNSQFYVYGKRPIHRGVYDNHPNDTINYRRNTTKPCADFF